MTFAKECWPFVLPFAAAALLLLAFAGPAAALVAALLGVAVLLFFRVPRRDFRGAPELLLAPANGRVTRIDRVSEPDLGPGEHQRVCTFLSVFDVHVQRAPAAGEVLSSRRRSGRKSAAFLPHADRVNESHLTVLERSNGDRIGVRQIAGLLARRVVSYLEPGQRVERGELIGIIKFGSRVDLLFPGRYRLLVRQGQRLREGMTPVAEAGGETHRPAGGAA